MVDLQDRVVKAGRGGTIVVVGRSGSGKSTLLTLIQRLRDPSHGAVKINGRHIRDFTTESIHAKITRIPQDPGVFQGTIAELARLGRPEASFEQVQEACEKSAVHDFVKRYSNAYNTYVGEGGVVLSGGQRQRINIARALLRRPSVLSLDEATSGLDVTQEEGVLDAIRRALPECILFIATHRMRIIERASQVIFLRDDGPGLVWSHSDLLEDKEYSSVVRGGL